jgi:hypothetical protein
MPDGRPGLHAHVMRLHSTAVMRGGGHFRDHHPDVWKRPMSPSRLRPALIAALLAAGCPFGFAQTQAHERRVLALYFDAAGSVYIDVETRMGDAFKCAPSPMYWFSPSDAGSQLIASNLVMAITNGRKVTLEGTGQCSPATSEFGSGYERLKRLSLFRTP